MSIIPPKTKPKERSEYFRNLRMKRQPPKCPDGSFTGWSSGHLRNLAGSFGVYDRGYKNKASLCQTLSKFKNDYLYPDDFQDLKPNVRSLINPKKEWYSKRANDVKNFMSRQCEDVNYGNITKRKVEQ